MSSDRLKGQVERITFHNPENGFTIAQVLPEGGRDVVTVVGAMAGPSAGETVEIVGTWATHPRYGRQLKIASYRPVLPSSAEGIERYLASGLIPGIGPVIARRIVEQFGEETLSVIDGNPRRLLRVPGLGRQRVKRIAAAWAEQRGIRDVMVFLQSHGVGTGHAVRIYREYGEEAIQVVRANPYRLEREVRGIGFLTADRIAGRLGLAPSAPERVQAGVRYLLDQAADEGHAYLPETELVVRGAELLGVDRVLLPPALVALRTDGGIAVEEGRHYLPRLHRAEVGVARALARLQEVEGAALAAAPPPEAGAGEVELRQGQPQAVALALGHKLMVRTGGPGTGKT
ncbi:MAG: helix-hairpin-helix domain-containing protein, partial [Gemmatimonadota bacterium]